LANQFDRNPRHSPGPECIQRHDRLGCPGGDTLSGRRGNDTINGDTGTDNLYGGDGNDKLFGGADGDLLDGGAGNDTLNGGTADDTMRGGAGNDTYVVDNAADVVEEASGGGTDTVNSSVTFSLAGQYIEKLNLTGAAAINGTGNSLNNTIKGNAANNIINGGTGADRMEGGGGDDRYYVDNAGDVVIEANGAGNDRVVSTVSFSLAGQYIDRLTLDGTVNINGTGNSLNNGITGNTGDNTLNGGTGNDTLDGGGGTDTLNGQAGNDTLTGGTGADFFVFNTALSASTNVDTITDFTVNVDKMRLENAIFTTVGADLASNEFLASTSGAATTSTQRILYDTTDGRLYYDPDGNGAQARIHFATLSAGLALDHLDFVVI
jgi:Ca2+-binding RTX toxin-like protein